MKIYVNGFAINEATNEVYVDQGITGLEIPPIRRSSGNLSGQSGGYSGLKLYGPRNISIQGRIFTGDAHRLEQRRREIQDVLVGTEEVTLRIVTTGGSAYVIYAKLVDFDMPIPRAPTSATYKIELVADDSLIYDDTIGTEFTVPLKRMASGGFTFPILFPFIFQSGSLPATAINNGAVAIKPVVRLTGSMTAPVITQRTTGQVLRMPTLVTGTTDTIEIDMRTHTVLQNDSSIYGKKAGDWLYLQKGSNSIELTTSSSSDTVTGTISWRSGYLGI